MIGHLHGQVANSDRLGNSFWYGPALKDTVVFETEVVMQRPGPVFLDHEPSASWPEGLMSFLDVRCHIQL